MYGGKMSDNAQRLSMYGCRILADHLEYGEPISDYKRAILIRQLRSMALPLERPVDGGESYPPHLGGVVGGDALLNEGQGTVNCGGLAGGHAVTG
jgi:hypothetical protein